MKRSLNHWYVLLTARIFEVLNYVRAGGDERGEERGEEREGCYLAPVLFFSFSVTAHLSCYSKALYT